MAAFGLPDDTPAFGYMRLVGFISGVVGLVTGFAEGDPSTATTLFWGGIVVGALGTYLSWQQSRYLTRERAFKQHLDEYVAGERDDLPE